MPLAMLGMSGHYGMSGTGGMMGGGFGMMMPFSPFRWWGAMAVIKNYLSYHH